ncbi:MAG: ATP-binding protein [Candidatus Woesearchaeota archaeon]|jgi:DNA helicase HerA-like ATPase|nr:ATP-binding protein [Candidatus Woesearchaeota archaeon]MDP7457318.1 ATP-binding protein [Candidatus Woesearchaeota archaeon]
MIKGQIVSGGYGKIKARVKADEKIEMGEILIAEGKEKILMQVTDVEFGAQMSEQSLELYSGMKMEQGSELFLMDKELRTYTLATLKGMVSIDEGSAFACKSMPKLFSELRGVLKDDLNFITKPQNPLFIGKLRSGSKALDVDLFLDGKEVFSHHILIPATTGRGKSNLVKTMLWDSIDKDYCGVLVLDPHDEYYGRNGVGMKDHATKEKVVYYTPKDVPPGGKTLKINLKKITPLHFSGVVEWSDPQIQALYSYWKKYGEDWIKSLVMEDELSEREKYVEGTLNVVRRRLLQLLDLDVKDDALVCNGIFDTQAGETVISDICSELENGKCVIIDTSHFEGSVEILIGSLIATDILRKYRFYSSSGVLKDKPVISVVLEEAPRVLGKEVLERGSNIFKTIAREGRKFKVGLMAITQLPSLIPRDILANMNTKIILGIEMKPERQAIIESSAQDLSDDDRNISSLDKGEAIVSSNFVKFATPLKIPLFEEFVKVGKKPLVKKDFGGVEIS